MPQAAVTNRSHEKSVGPKLLFAGLHGVIVAVCLWLAFSGLEWPDTPRARVLAICALLYFLRHLVTLFVLLKRRVSIAEVLGLSMFMAIFEIGFLLLGAGVFSGNATNIGALDWFAASLVLIGSFLNTGSEIQRWRWKKKPSSKDQCYTGGLFGYSMHINYFGDVVLFSGWALLTSSFLASSIPIFMTVSFVLFHIPTLDAYLLERYGDQFRTYAAKTAKFVPFIY